MTRPKFRRRPEAIVAAWGRFGACLRWNDPPRWRWPRVELHRGDDDATGVLIGWRLTGLAFMYLHPVVHVDVAPPVVVPSG